MKLSMIKLKLQKRSPEILAVAGVVGIVTTVVVACKATTKLSKITDEAKENLEAIQKAANKDDLDVEYTAEDAKDDTRIVYVQTAVKIVKLYLPAAAIGTASIAAMLASNNILRKRYVGIAAAYSAVSQDFKGYRKRVVERFGERVDHELKHNIKAVEIEEMETDEKGKEKKVKKTIDVIDSPDGYSEYARWFDESCGPWEKNAEFNLNFLIAQQKWANQRLTARGYLFLNEVYEALDIPTTRAGQIVGWIYDPDDESGRFNNFVDFGIYEANRNAREFVNGYERCFLIDPNVDGNILDLMD